MESITQVTDLQSIFVEIDNSFDEIVSWRRYLHQHPELSFEETETAKYIADKLESFGLEVKKNIGGNGLIGILTGVQPGKTIALRADFDALPIEDEKEVPYKSVNPGVMHACGHDGHTTALLGTAQVLSKYRDKVKGKVIFIFQPAEEKPPGGAKFMIEENVLEDVDYVFAAHLDSKVPIGKVSVGEGYKMAAVDKFEIKIQGLGGHGARPQDSVDSIVIGSEIVNSLQKIVSRRINPLESAVVTIGVFHAGSAFNIIADTAKLEGTVRTFSESVRKQVREEIYSIVKGITEGFHANAEIDYLHGYPALYNHPKESYLVQQLLSDVFGEDQVIDIETSMGAEDFSYFLLEKPGTYFKVGSNNEDESTHYPHHHPKFDFDERALLNIQKSFVQIVAHYLF
ncbi:M20 metallopeptidase family protein [Psychrobacillus lasiicapitis]|uniref:Amidohydrolase n=1 Tax=Psychrobacillus lasiicapitis TaxID=1636719 RepID=A0A544TCA3_9BACI|nr:M20 family metallopeptidase [Psychrobacillus lasiicapitis]TQR15083.1 amidohydrolase [Psychrobacillus lasiicapitis]GGA22317.1 putative amidohydrolase YhaA [Psychrobacillus lasiicapitis]